MSGFSQSTGVCCPPVCRRPSLARRVDGRKVCGAGQPTWRSSFDRKPSAAGGQRLRSPGVATPGGGLGAEPSRGEMIPPLMGGGEREKLCRHNIFRFCCDTGQESRSVLNRLCGAVRFCSSCCLAACPPDIPVGQQKPAPGIEQVVLPLLPPPLEGCLVWRSCIWSSTRRGSVGHMLLGDLYGPHRGYPAALCVPTGGVEGFLACHAPLLGVHRAYQVQISV